MKKIRIAAQKRIAKDVFLLSLEYQPIFLPGQVIGITDKKELPERLYSICSAPGEHHLKVLYDIKTDGRLTPRLAGMKSGDFVYISEPSGNFICPQDEKAWWIAAGTGIAPFASMFYAGNLKNKRLIHGGRFRESFYFQEDIGRKLGEDYIRCCTQEQGEGLYHGRLTQWLREQDNLPVDYKYYLCGSAEMVVQTRDLLVSLGIAYDQVISEIYF